MATAAQMRELGIFTALDLRAKDETFLLKHFGKAGRAFLPHLPRHRSPAGAPKSHPQIRWSGDHVLSGPNANRRHEI